MFTLQFFRTGVDVIKGNKILSLTYEDLLEDKCKEFWETKIIPNVIKVENYSD